MTLSGAGYIRRDTYIDAGGALTASATVIPDGNGFSLPYHDEVFRWNGTRGTKRWPTQMTFVIWTRKFKCIQSNTVTTQNGKIAESCLKGEALQESSSAFASNYTNVIASDVSKLTGGRFQANITLRDDFSAGEHVTFNDLTGDSAGNVNFFFVEYPENSETNANFSWARTVWYARRSDSYYGRIYSAHVVLNAVHLNSTRLQTHELAHTLGWSHPNGYDFSQYDGGSVMDNDGVTARDELQGRIMYLRPWGSRTPDVDPNWFRLNVTNGSELFRGYAGRGGLKSELVY